MRPVDENVSPQCLQDPRRRSGGIWRLRVVTGTARWSSLLVQTTLIHVSWVMAGELQGERDGCEREGGEKDRFVKRDFDSVRLVDQRWIVKSLVG